MAVNLLVLSALARRLEPILPELVFVGGATVELYITEPAAARPRVTRDVDVVCEAESRLAYHRLGERLRALGFSEDQNPGAPIGRWTCAEGVLDLMPKEPSILGFSNPWYDLGIATAMTHELENGLRVRLLQPPVFVATKLAAYEGRGGGDPYTSHDIEDLVVVTSGRPELLRSRRRIPPSEARSGSRSSGTWQVTCGRCLRRICHRCARHRDCSR